MTDKAGESAEIEEKFLGGEEGFESFSEEVARGKKAGVDALGQGVESLGRDRGFHYRLSHVVAVPVEGRE